MVPLAVLAVSYPAVCLCPSECLSVYVGVWSCLVFNVTGPGGVFELGARGGGLGSRLKKMYGVRLGDGIEYHLMSPTPRR